MLYFPHYDLKTGGDPGYSTLTSYRTFLKGLHFILVCTGRSNIFLVKKKNIHCWQY